MKNIHKIILASSLFLLPLVSFGQQTMNQMRIKQINQSMEEAKNDGNYELGIQLKEERDIRLKIEKSIETNNFKEAQRLQDLIDKKEAENSFKNLKQTSSPIPDGGLDYRNHISLKSGAYIKTGAGYGYLVDDYTSNHAFTIGLGIGHRFTRKNTQNEQQKLGFDVSWFSISYGMRNLEGFFFMPKSFVAMEIHFPSPGFYYAHALDEKKGLEASLNIGPGMIISNSDEYFSLGIKHQFLYRINQFSMGLALEINPISRMSSSTSGSFLKILPTIAVKF